MFTWNDLAHIGALGMTIWEAQRRYEANGKRGVKVMDSANVEEARTRKQLFEIEGNPTISPEEMVKKGLGLLGEEEMIAALKASL